MIHDSSINWRVVATSVCGTSHQQRSQPCQDAHCWHSPAAGVLVAAVADGAGSAAFGEVGAQLAVNVAVETLSDRIGAVELEHWLAATATLPATEIPPVLTDLKVALEAAREAVVVEADTRQTSLREFATTLILVVVTPQWVAAAQIGDGAAIAGNRDEDGDRIGALTSPSSGEYINETTFLVSPQALETAQLNLWHESIEYLALFTDGLQLLALDMSDSTPHPPFFSPLFRFISQDELELSDAQIQLESFLNSDRVTQRTDDDLTLLLAAKIG
jgi:Protein phosphatase 2C